MKYIIDRFEGEYAVCENEKKEFSDIKRNLLPVEVKEGSSFNMDSHGNITLLDDSERRDRIKKKMDSVWR